jgi:hypothetical protein
MRPAALLHSLHTSLDEEKLALLGVSASSKALGDSHQVLLIIENTSAFGILVRESHRQLQFVFTTASKPPRDAPGLLFFDPLRGHLYNTIPSDATTLSQRACESSDPLRGHFKSTDNLRSSSADPFARSSSIRFLWT